MKKRPKYLSNHERTRELRAYVALCFNLIGETDLREIVNRTGLHISTVQRLANGQASLYCRYNTIDALGRAAGYRLAWTRTGHPRTTFSRKL